MIYLDHHATTPLDPRVLAAMLPYFGERFGNAASKSHRFGWEAEEAVEKARRQVAALIGAGPSEIVFTSGATESDNLALKGVIRRLGDRPRHLVVSAIEHRAVLDSARRLEREGAAVTVLGVGSSGRVDPDDLRRALRPETALVSVMAANNEVGTIQPIEELGRICREAGVLFHTDAAQAAGKIPLDARRQGFDLLSLSAHKTYGPKGIGALYVRGRGKTGTIRLEPLFDGGGQEGGLRPGTVAVPLVVGLGAAAEIAGNEMAGELQRIEALRDRLLAGLRAGLDRLEVNGDLAGRLAGNLNLSFAEVEGEALMMGLKDIAVSSGSACTSGTIEPSHVLKAMGLSDLRAHTALRFGIGRGTTEAEIDRVVAEVTRHVLRLRAMAPLAAGPAQAAGPAAAR